MMNPTEEKIEKLLDIARLYYEQDKTQNEIAGIYGVSRPLVSRMLKEAKEFGIVKIEISSPMERNKVLLNQVFDLFGIKGARVIPDGTHDSETNDAIARAALEYMASLEQSNFGIGWGHIIGNMIRCMEDEEPIEHLAHRICPLIGNSGGGNRNYHSNEMVRIFSLQTGAASDYLYAPAFVLSEQELVAMKGLENYKTVYQCWENLDVALVNIGNYPSSPDFASAARYGDILTKQKAVGRLLNYYFDIEGKFFHSDFDFSLQIPLEVLARTRHVIGICSANTKPEALLGALRTGLIHHLIASENVVKAAEQAAHHYFKKDF